MQISSPQTNSTSKSYKFVTILLPTGYIHFSLLISFQNGNEEL